MPIVRIGAFALALALVLSWAGSTQKLQEENPPALPGSGMPYFAHSPEGNLHLSWIDALPRGGHALRLSEWTSQGWKAPETVASGENWFVNWADFPAVSFLPNGAAYAHWLARPVNGGKFGYGIRLAHRGSDGHWKQTAGINEQDEQDYAGFLSFAGKHAAFLSPASPADGHRKTLHSLLLDDGGRIAEERILDADVCSCCPTSIVKTSSGLLIAYRDHLPGEIRDISLVRYAKGKWSEPYGLHRDGWKINACPTEGPSLAVAGGTIGAAWITRAGGVSRLRFAYSQDDGESFSEAVEADGGNPLGRARLISLNDGSFALSWIERNASGAEIRLRRVSATGSLAAPILVREVEASRAAGIPQIALHRGEIWVAWREETVKAVRLPEAALPR